MGSCDANRRKLEGQNAIKRKFRLKWDKTKLVSHFWGAKNVEKKEEKKKKRKCMDFYDFVWICMDDYGFVWILVGSLF